MFAQLGDVAAANFWWLAVAVFLVGVTAETLRPRNETSFPAFRWASNFVLYIACVLLAAAVVHAASLATLAPFPRVDPFAFIRSVGGDISVLIVGILSLDLFAYVIHRLEHSVFCFWRFHAVHHSDVELDVSTALRHHPVEYATTTVVISAVFALLGLPVWVLAVYGLMFFLSSLFQHLNVRFPPRAERAIQAGLVSPDMHRLHHSADPRHYNFNFGSVFSIWDRAFGTYRMIASQDSVTFGVGIQLRRWTGLWLPWILPFSLHRPAGRSIRAWSRSNRDHLVAMRERK